MYMAINKSYLFYPEETSSFYISWNLDIFLTIISRFINKYMNDIDIICVISSENLTCVA